MALLRNQRFLALLLVLAAILGLLVANSPLADGLHQIEESVIAESPTGLQFDVLSFIEELLLPLFFFLIGLELKHELLHGHFKQRIRLVTPGLAAVLGAAMPALIYVAVCASEPSSLNGWAIPTATDVTFALAVFVLFGSSMPASSRTFLLAFATIDDAIAIVIIAALFGTGFKIVWFTAAIAAFISFYVLQRAIANPWLSLALGLLAWYFTVESGVHPSVAGVVLGLLVRSESIHSYEFRLQPWVGALVLPLFAFVATDISLDGAALAVSSLVFVGVMLRPIGKILGIALGALIAEKLLQKDRDSSMNWRDYLAVSTLGGIGFTVSILVTGLAFNGYETESDAALLATVLSALVSVIIGAFALQYRRLGKTKSS